MTVSLKSYRLTMLFNLFYWFNGIHYPWPIFLVRWLKEEGRKETRQKKVNDTKSDKISSLILETKMNSSAFYSPPQQHHKVNTSVIMKSPATFSPQTVV